MTYQPNEISRQEMTELLRILAGDVQTIINPEMLLESGELFDKIDIYGLAAVVSGLKTLMERRDNELLERIEQLERKNEEDV